MSVFISPTEHHHAIASLGRTSPLPEQHGCDILVLSPHTRVGFQRKEVKDFVASIQDGRLAKELGQIESSSLLTHACLIIEGTWSWTTDGQSTLPYVNLSRASLRSILSAVQLRGILLHASDDAEDTARVVATVSQYLAKAKHSSLDRRPKQRNAWGTIDSESFASHLLQSFPGVGPDTAKRIFDRFGVPLTWTVTEDELQTISGIGKQTAHRLISSCNGLASRSKLV